jgi:hypothetical protein
MDFINWWFDTHYVWSTILTPVFSFIWGIYIDSVSRVIWAGIMVIISGSFGFSTINRK